MVLIKYCENIFHKISELVGSPFVGLLSLIFIMILVIFGFFVHFSNMWVAFVHVTTTLITFAMIFIVQCTQNRETSAIQIKLSEIIRALEKADNANLDLEKKDLHQLHEIQEKYTKLAEEARTTLNEEPDNE